MVFWKGIPVCQFTVCKDLSRPQFVFDLKDLIVSLERVLWL